MRSALKISIMRFDPNQDKEPWLQRVEVPAENGATVQQALFGNYIVNFLIEILRLVRTGFVV